MVFACLTVSLRFGGVAILMSYLLVGRVFELLDNFLRLYVFFTM